MRRFKSMFGQASVVALVVAGLAIVGSEPAGAAIGSWSSNGPASARVFALAMDANAIRTVYAGTDQGVFKTLDAGGSWFPSGTWPADTTVRSLAIDRNATQTVYAGLGNRAGDEGSLYKTTDGGVTWTQLSGYTANREVLSLAIDRRATQTVYAGTRLGGVFKSTDGGTSWTPANNGISGSTPSVIALVGDPNSTPTTMYAGTATGVFKTIDGGENWVAAGLTGSIVRTLVIDPTAEPVVMYAGVASSDDTVHRVFKTADGGATWIEMSSGLPGDRIRALLIDRTASQTVYVGTEGGGVYRTLDGGASWSVRNRGLTNLNVRALVMDRSAGPTAYAGTLGDGVFTATAPVFDTTITNKPDGVTTDTAATFEFVSAPEGGTFECSLDMKPFGPCTSPATYSGLQPGSHSFSVKAGADPTPAAWAWEIRPVVGELWPACAADRTQFCVRSLSVNGVDQTAGGAWEVKAQLRDSGNVYSATWEVVPANGDWGPSPLSTDVELSINIGDLQPLYTESIARLRWLETSGTPDTGYVLHAFARPILYSWRVDTSSGNCFTGECGDENTQADIEAYG